MAAALREFMIVFISLPCQIGIYPATHLFSYASHAWSQATPSGISWDDGESMLLIQPRHQQCLSRCPPAKGLCKDGVG